MEKSAAVDACRMNASGPHILADTRDGAGRSSPFFFRSTAAPSLPSIFSDQIVVAPPHLTVIMAKITLMFSPKSGLPGR